jgi:hypothetical protein
VGRRGSPPPKRRKTEGTTKRTNETDTRVGKHKPAYHLGTARAHCIVIMLLISLGCCCCCSRPRCQARGVGFPAAPLPLAVLDSAVAASTLAFRCFIAHRSRKNENADNPISRQRPALACLDPPRARASPQSSSHRPSCERTRARGNVLAPFLPASPWHHQPPPRQARSMLVRRGPSQRPAHRRAAYGAGEQPSSRSPRLWLRRRRQLWRRQR